MQRIGWHVLVAVLCLSAQAALGMVIAEDGEARVRVFLAREASQAERTAAEELCTYLAKSTGGAFAVEEEPDAGGAPGIYVGGTALAGAHGLAVDALEPEEWGVVTVGEALILIGGRPRGTLYGVYHFLEDVVGVHWWNPFEESVPARPTLDIGEVNRRGEPVLRYRDIYMLYGRDQGRFAARNRLNRDGDAGIGPEYGGEMDYGPPYHVHTFYKYVPPEEHFAEHPEWYSLIDGEREHKRKQLCLTNSELREYMLARLRGYIELSSAGARKRGLPAPRVFSVSQNDWRGACECDACQAIAKAEGSEAGPLLDFVNYLADGIKEDYPDVYVDTLAYMMTQQAPKSIRPRENVIIRLCDTKSNFTKAITDEANTAFREHLLSWASIAENLRVWDYAVTYAPFYGLPMPTVHTYGADYQFYAEHNVKGVFTEHEYPILADMRDFKVWMMMKLLEDPYQDYERLVRTFTDGFYGPAGEHVRAYLAALEAASAAKPSYLSMGATPRMYRYLDVAFIREAQGLFDRAEAAVEGDTVLLRRVRHARMPLDRAMAVLAKSLMTEWIEAGNKPDAFPLDRAAAAERYRGSWKAEADLRLAAGQREAEKARADEEVSGLLALQLHVPLPEKFRGLPPTSVFGYTPEETRNWQDIVKRVADEESETGVTNRLELTDEDMVKYKLPMPWGVYDRKREKTAAAASIRPEEVPGPGYHWYKLGPCMMTASQYVYFFWSWIIQVDVGNAFDAAHPEQRFDVWARVKFEGPGFPHGKEGDVNAICVERVVLVKEGAAGGEA